MIEINAEIRKVTGKQNRKIRRQGYVPASISMADGSTLILKIRHNDLWPLRKSKEVQIIKVKVTDAKKEVDTVLSEMVINPLTNFVENVSFTEITDKSHIKVEVPVVFKGVSPAVKNNLGVLVVSMPYIKLTVNKSNLIDKIEVDISNLENVGQRLLVEDVVAHIKDVKLASAKDAKQTVVTVRPLQKVVKSTAPGSEASTEGEAEEGTEEAESAQSSETTQE